MTRKQTSINQSIKSLIKILFSVGRHIIMIVYSMMASYNIGNENGLIPTCDIDTEYERDL